MKKLNAETRKAERGGTYYQIREAFGLDDLLIRHPEKQHLIVNLPVVRSRKGPDYHKANHEKKFSGFYREGLSVIEPGKGKPEVADGLVFTPFADYDFKKRPDDSGSPSFTEVLDFIRAHNENLPAKPLEPVNYLREGMMKNHPDAMKIVSDNFSRYEYFDHCALSHQTSHKKQFSRWIYKLSKS